MSVTINNSPVHSESMISYPYGVVDSGYSCGWHTGVDIVPHGSTENNPLLYPCVKGRIVATPTDNVLGVQVQILDENGFYWRYCHMMENSRMVQVGDLVDINTPLGRMGATGNVTGRHLHLECSTTQNWQCSTFVNPCEKIGIPNIDDTIIYYDGTIPPQPIYHNKNIKKWIFAKSKKFLINY